MRIGALGAVALLALSLEISACNCGGSERVGKRRGEPIHPEIVSPKLTVPLDSPTPVDPPKLVPVMIDPPIVHGPRQTDAYIQDQAIVDVLWVVDNSGTMNDKRMRLAAEFDQFIATLLGANVDYHIGVTSTDLTAMGDQGRLRGPVPFIDPMTPNPTDAFRQMVDFPSDSRVTLDEALGAMNRALTPPNSTGPNSGFLRNEAALAVIVVSDGSDDSIGPTEFFTRFLKSLKGPGREVNTSLSAVVGDLPDGCTPAGEEHVFGAKARPGIRDTEVARATGGLVESICTADFGPFVNDLATRLSSLRRIFQLSAPPKEMTIEVRVDGVLVPRDEMNGWSYLPSARAIRFNGNRVPRPGADIRITYDVQT
jgi:hypothetical protein